MARGKRRINLEMPLNRHIRLNRSQIQGLEVPTDFKEFTQLCRVRSGSAIVPFELWDWQEELAKIADTYKVVVGKTRQLGVTELFACKMLHKACLSPAYSGAVLSLGGKETSKVAKRVRRMPSAIEGFKFTTNAVTELQIAGVAPSPLPHPPTTPCDRLRVFMICSLMRPGFHGISANSTPLLCQARRW